MSLKVRLTKPVYTFSLRGGLPRRVHSVLSLTTPTYVCRRGLDPLQEGRTDTTESMGYSSCSSSSRRSSGRGGTLRVGSWAQEGSQGKKPCVNREVTFLSTDCQVQPRLLSLKSYNFTPSTVSLKTYVQLCLMGHKGRYRPSVEEVWWITICRVLFYCNLRLWIIVSIIIPVVLCLAPFTVGVTTTTSTLDMELYRYTMSYCMFRLYVF